MGSLEEQDSSGCQVISSCVAVAKLTGTHQGGTFSTPAIPGSNPLPQPSTPSIVNGRCTPHTHTLKHFGDWSVLWTILVDGLAHSQLLGTVDSHSG